MAERVRVTESTRDREIEEKKWGRRVEGGKDR